MRPFRRWPGWPPRLRPDGLRGGAGLRCGGSLDGGRDEFDELRSRRASNSSMRVLGRVPGLERGAHRHLEGLGLRRDHIPPRLRRALRPRHPSKMLIPPPAGQPLGRERSPSIFDQVSSMGSYSAPYDGSRISRAGPSRGGFGRLRVVVQETVHHHVAGTRVWGDHGLAVGRNAASSIAPANAGGPRRPSRPNAATSVVARHTFGAEPSARRPSGPGRGPGSSTRRSRPRPGGSAASRRVASPCGETSDGPPSFRGGRLPSRAATSSCASSPTAAASAGRSRACSRSRPSP